MRLNTVGIRLNPNARPIGAALPTNSSGSPFPAALPQAPLSLRAFPANPAFPLGAQTLSALLELQSEDADVDEDGRRKEEPDQHGDKKQNNRANT